MIIDWIINVLLAIIGVLFALWYENLGTSHLEINPEETSDSTRPDLNNHRVRFLHLNVTNKPKKLWFIPRQTAYSCHGTITFLDNQSNQIGPPMPIKWDGTVEPIKPEIVNTEIRYLVDNNLLRYTRYIDIPPDETESLAFAVRLDNEDVAFGWTGESYQHNWRHPVYKLLQGNYTARVKISSGDNQVQKDFMFKNTAKFDEFDLCL